MSIRDDSFCYSEKTCPICKKKFYIRPGVKWGFVAGHRLVCSWTCKKRWDKAMAERYVSKFRGLKRTE